MKGIEVKIKLKPYVTRVRNIYRHYRTLHLPPIPALWQAAIDCARLSKWWPARWFR